VKKIFVTGASAGIGKTIAAALLEQGHEVWGTSRDIARLPTLDRFHRVSLDLMDAPSVDRAFSAALAEAGHFDVVINNAGSGHFGPAETLPAQILEQQFQGLVLAQVQIMQLALRDMRARSAGLIVNVTSLAARLPVPFMAGYNAAKAAMATFTMTMQLELSDSPVRIVDLQPGNIRTQFNDAMVTNRDPRYEDKIEKIFATIERHMQQAAPPELVAQRVCALLDQTNPPPRVTVGDAFPAHIAPVIFRFLPQRLRIWGLKFYYGL
jgi:short-subunit dehydrogenase